MNRQSKIHHLLLAIICFALFAYKFQYLSYPSGWDEAYPYSFAIDHQVKNGISILPSGMPSELSTGHPTLFYTSAAIWIKCTGGNMSLARLFPLLLTFLSFLLTYKIGAKFLTKKIGMAAVVLLATRALVVAQSTQILPETLVTFFTLLTLYNWLSGNRIWYVVSGSLLLLTKEPGIVLIFILSVIDFLTFLRTKEKSAKLFFRNCVLTASPVFAAIAFFIIQKIQNGWYFFPRHMNWFASETSGTFKDKFIGKYCAHMFMYYGGIAFSVITVIAILFFIFRKNNFQNNEKKTILTFSVFISIFLLFSALNFSSPRYILCLYPLWILTGLYFVSKLFTQSTNWIFTSLVILLAGFQSYYTHFFRTQGDYDMGYVDGVKLESEIIKWCYENNYRDSSITAQHVMERNMTNSAPGYVKPGEEFTNVSKHFTTETALCIFTSQENDPDEDLIPKSKLILRAKFEFGKSNAEIYSVKK